MKKERFNEEIPDEVSTRTKKSKYRHIKLRLHSPSHLKKFEALEKNGLSGVKEKNQESKLDFALPKTVRPTNPDRNFRNMLIKSIELMDNKEMKVMKSAIDSAHNFANIGELNKENLACLNEIDGIKVEYPEEEAEEKEYLEEESELKDDVPDLLPDADQVKSSKSKNSSFYISQLESQIQEERKEREKIQKELEELKKYIGEGKSEAN